MIVKKEDDLMTFEEWYKAKRYYKKNGKHYNSNGDCRELDKIKELYELLVSVK